MSTETVAPHRPALPEASTVNNASEVTRALLACGAVAGPIFLVVVILQVLTRSGFDLGHHPISLLSVGDFGWIQIANFIVSGLLMLAFAIGLRRLSGGTWGPLLIGVYGLGLIVAGVFVPDPAWSFPPGSPEGIPSQISWHATMHGVGFALAFGSVSLACLVMARRSMANGQRTKAAYAVASAVTAIVLAGWPGLDAASVRYFAAAVIVWTWTVVLAIDVNQAAARNSA